jgi:ATP-dependent Lhr-like helicase
LCHDGEVAWLRTNPPARAIDAPAVAPSKATPISLVARVDLPWLLMAARATGDPGEPVVGATAEIIEVLRERGACFASELGAATNRLPEDIERALWDGVARGLVMSDGFGAIRSRVTGNGRQSSGRSPGGRRFSRLARGPRLATAAAGRWSLVPNAEAVALSDLAAADRDELAEAVAELLLHRWGVIFRDLVLHDSFRFPWRDLQWALRRLEDRGLVRGGRFVTGFSGEQYALPAAHEQLTQTRRAPKEGERVTVNATDPLNLVGVIVPGARVPAVRTRRVTFVDGVAEATDLAAARAT